MRARPPALPLPTFSAAIEMRSINQRLDNVLRIYVGDEPHRQILSGAIRRGQVIAYPLRHPVRGHAELHAHHLGALAGSRRSSLLNDYFDCLVPPSRRRAARC